MGREITGSLRAGGLSFCLIASRFNEPIVKALVNGAEERLREAGAGSEAIDIVWVPGAFELPLAAQQAARRGKYAALVCLGAVIRGETPHFDFVAAETARGISEVSRAESIPIGFGVLTTDTPEQALARAGGTHGNKGAEAASAALEMAGLLSQL